MTEIPAQVLKEAADLADRRARVAEALHSDNSAFNLEQLRADLEGDGPSLAEMIKKQFRHGARRHRP